MLFLLPVVAAASGAQPGQMARMAQLYDQVCLHAFPDDKAVEALMIARQATPLPQDEVKVTMRDDPARAWQLKDGSATVWIEFPAYHACTVRWNSPGIGDLSAYRAIADRYEHATGTFSPMDAYETDDGDIHVHAVGEERTTDDGGSEALFVFDQSINNPKRRAAGETGYSLRFVHQYHSADSK